jgi:hypothetical protein
MRRRASEFLLIGHLACSLKLCTVVVLLSGLMGCKAVVQHRALVLSTGMAHSCAILEDRSLRCWGEDEAGFFEFENCGGDSVFGANGLACGQSSPPEGRFRELASSGLASCAIDEEAELHCWGRGFAAGSVPMQGTFHALVSETMSERWCALDEAGRAHCWSASGPALSPPELRFVDVALNGTGLCGVVEDGSLGCVALAPGASAPSPPAEGRFRAIAADSELFCAISEAETLSCWGSNASQMPTEPSQRWERFSGEGVCARRSDGVFVCFRDGFEPLEVSGFEELSMGEAHYCGLRSDGRVECATHSKHVRCPDCTEVPKTLR